ncbi:hypothetical protein [Pseudomonas sp. Hg5Tf]|uniref:Uncharacterized protein n=1 Tax=Pseudomonas sp. Hg7Tf TaxID=3236988 RepID=A0AB39HWH3_9PSED|nr:hypothetical protein [Pseudomonas sp. Hg5Tf]MDH2559045.1 hypothetical protein [Pseudomonas sp. Hg5Tf]
MDFNLQGIPMPTENRSSNTEQMVSVPREVAEQIATDTEHDNDLLWIAKEMRKILSQPAAQHQGEPASWSTDKPEAPGAYWIRGFNLSGEFNEAALVQVARDEDANCLMVNLHQSTTESDTGYWYEVDDINAKFEWSGPLYLHPPTSDGFSAGDMADQGAKAFAARDPEVQVLRAKLAERDNQCANLRATINAVRTVFEDNVDVVEYIDALTTGSAEPSAPVEIDQGIPGTSFQRLNMLANQGE